MSEIGKTVWRAWGKTLRWGVIRKCRTEDKWKYYNIEWVDDDLYKRVGEYRKRLLGKQGKDLQIYKPIRCDRVNVANLEEIRKIIDTCLSKTLEGEENED